MGLKDLVFVAPFFAAEAALAVLIAYALARFRPDWPRRRVRNLAALPIPAVIWGLCVVIFVSAYTASKEECGVDACGMAAAAAMFVATTTIGLFLIGLVFASLGLRLAGKAASGSGSGDQP